MSEWQNTTLGNVINFQRGFDITRAVQRPGPIPVVSSGGISSYHDTASASGPGVVIGRKGTLGKTFFLKDDYWPHDTTLWVQDFRGSDPRFVYYFMSNVDVSWLDAGSANPTLNRNHLHPLKVSWPPVSEQRAIAEVLGALDDKIAANNACIRLIDEHLAAEYERSLQQEKIVEELGVIAEFHNKRRIPLSAKQRDERPGNVPYYGASGVFGYVDEALFDEPLVLVGEDGSVINADGTPVTQYIWGPAWVNNHAHALKGKVVSTELLYYAIRRSQVSTLVTGAVQPKINMGNLKRLQLSLPALESRTSMETIIAAEVAAKRAFTTEKRTLTATRDALLPQLMSGKLRVKDAEKVVEKTL